jgi:hypothetical protein
MATASGEALVKQFFGQGGIDNKTAVYTGEMLDSHFNKPTFGQSLPANVNVTQKLLKQVGDHAVHSVTLSRGNQSQDWYVFLVQERQVWKISALRNFVIPKSFFIDTQTLSEKNNRSTEEEYTFQNRSLTLKSDVALHDYVKSNIQTFNAISAQAKNNIAAANTATKILSLQKTQYDTDTQITDITLATIPRSGNIAGNTMGYMHIPEKKHLPRMSEDGYIYIANITGHWFLYKKKDH